MTGTRLGWLWVAVLALAACDSIEDEVVTHELFVMATRVDLMLPRSATAQDPTLLATIERELRELERDYYAWGDGELAALNRALTATGRFAASDAMLALIANAQRIARTSNLAFDPGVGTLVELWGFHQGEPPSSPPADERIAATLGASGSIDDLVIENGVITVAPPAAGQAFTLDLGGIAKGMAVDRVVAELAARGISPALVNAGGDLRVVGTRPDRRWRIGIQATRSDAMLGTIALDADEAAFTSGDYERYFDFEGVRQHHILDPRTGYPVTHTQAVTVIAASGALADAAATALLVAGPDAWRSMAGRLGVDAVLRVGADGSLDMTAAMRDRFQASAEVGSDIIAAVD